MGEVEPQWKRVKFGEVVRQVKSKVNPDTAGLDRFVAGEHMDTDDLKLRRWGAIGSGYLGPAFHARFRPGQVLYGSRRTYLRKVAVPDFEGICANTTFVLESTNPDILVPELLPFVMQTEAFHAHSKRESKGSVNPYVNFSDLAWYQFALPPRQEQLRLLDIFRAAEHVLETLRSALDRLRLARSALAVSYFANPVQDHVVDCRDLIATGAMSLQTGPFGTILKASAYTDDGYPVINPVDMNAGEINTDSCARIGEKDWLRLKQYWMRPGDMLLGRKRHMRNLVYVHPEHDGYVIGSDCIRFRVDPNQIHPRYLFHVLRSETTQHWLQAQAGGNGTVMPGMNEQIIGRLRMYLPDPGTQLRIAADFDAVAESDTSLVTRRAQAYLVRHALLARVFEEAGR